MAEQFLMSHSKLIGTIIVVAVFGGVLASITGRAVLRKWLLNGTDQNIQAIKDMLIHRIERVDEIAANACPIVYKGQTPLTKEDHQEICTTNQRYQASEIAGKHDVVMSEIKHLREGQRVVKEDIKTILRKVGG